MARIKECGAKIVGQLQNLYANLQKEELICREVITTYSKASQENLHSLLQGILIQAASEIGLWAFPEYKVHSSDGKPMINKGTILPDFPKKHKFFIKVDAAFLSRTGLWV